MTSQGSAHGRFQRAVATRNLFAAELAARELGHLSLRDALALAALYAALGSPKYERAAVRWLARLALERRGLRLAELQLAAAALANLGARDAAALRVLLELSG